MRKNIQNFHENHGDTARVVLFQLVAFTADYLILWPRHNATPVKTAINCVYSLVMHVAAYKAAKYLEAPKAQPVVSTTDGAKDNKASAASEDPNAFVRPATP